MVLFIIENLLIFLNWNLMQNDCTHKKSPTDMPVAPLFRIKSTKLTITDIEVSLSNYIHIYSQRIYITWSYDIFLSLKCLSPTLTWKSETQLPYYLQNNEKPDIYLIP